MHASVHELLSLRDDVVTDESVVAHVRVCGECGAELERLRAVTAELRALPDKWPAPERWGRIETALALNVIEPPRPLVLPSVRGKQKWPGWALPLAAAATVLVTVATLTWQGKEQTTAEGITDLTGQPPGKLDAAAAEVQTATQLALAARSHQLEQVLAVLPQEPSVTRAGTALTLADLKDRIRWVDYHLALGDKAGLEPQQAELLWQERVDLLNSLMAVRYAQTRTAF